MNKKLRFLISSTIVGLAFSTSQLIQAMDGISKPEEQSKPSGIQLSKGADYTLDAVLGTGNNVLLKLTVDLRALKRPIENEQIEKGQLEVPIFFFLTDFASSPTNHPVVSAKVKIDCDSTPPISIFPDKPPSFESYAQFTSWLSKGFFSNEAKITYDFSVDPLILAPSLTQHLYAVSPSGYRFIGTHAFYNAKIVPDKHTPKVTYLSQRGNTNTTTITLSGALYLGNKSYLIEDSQQVIPHPMIDQVIYGKNESKKFYFHKWLAQAQIIVKTTYEEFPNQLAQNWPNIPFETYALLQQKPGDLEEVDHLGGWDGTSGEEVDISDGRVFAIVCEGLNKPMQKYQYLESIVKDNTGNLYTVHYKYSEAETQKQESKHRQKLEREAAETRRIAEEERERIEKQEIEKRRKQEKIALWASGIDVMVQHVKTLQSVNYQFYGDCNPFLFDKLVKMFDPMKKYYKNEEQAKLCAEEYPKLDYKRLNENFPPDYAKLLGHISYLMQSVSEERSKLNTEKEYARRNCGIGGESEMQRGLFLKEQGRAMNLASNVKNCIKDLLKKKMENYVLYQGTFHPRWEELVKLFGQP